MSGRFGVFGKIPGAGDFLRSGLNPDFVKTWDQWLQTALVEARNAIGDRWLEAYHSAPIWRFTLPSGLAGQQAVSGILMASIDRVGRQYPLTIAAPHRDESPALVHFANRTVFEHLEEVALKVLDEDKEPETLLNELSGINVTEPPKARVEGATYAGVLPPVQVLAAEKLDERHGRSAVWTAMMEGDHRLMLSRGFPDCGQVRGLFDLSAPIWQSRAGVAQEI